MADKMLIDASHEEETRVVVVRGNRIEEFDFESQHKKQIRGNIYLAKVTRVEPSLQAAFVDYGGNRHGFLAFAEIHPDYYQIPLADRQALLRAEAEEHRKENDVEGDEPVSADPAYQDQPDIGIPSNEELAATDAPVEAVETVTEVAVVDAEAEVAEEAPKAKPKRVRKPRAKKAAAGDEAAASDDSAGDDDASGGTIAAMVEMDEISEEAGRRRGRDDDGDDDDDDHIEEKEEIESVGAEDAMEEVPDRIQRKPRKLYRIQEVIKRRQILLVQVAKEERGNKGAALTTYLSLAGRYSVLMPNTARGGGISRKITNPADRKRLKEIARGLEVPQGMGVILRTAGANRTKVEIKRDFEYLMRLWENVRTLTLASTAPCLVYEEGSLIKRSIRDLYNKDISEIVVSGEEGYREAKDFMKMLMPSHAKVVQPYRDLHPIFARSGIEAQLDRMLQPQVTLKSGGYIIINQTEALVSIDVNSGRSTREYSIEDTALQTNLEAAEEVARQLRLRDLAGLIVIDFIDMEEKRNNRSVEKKLKDCLKNDRARIQVGRISHFGLLEMSRQRIRASVLESTTQVCPHCQGTGLIRSQSSVALHVLRGIEEFLLKSTTHDIIVHSTPETALYLLNQKRGTIVDYEQRFGVSIVVEADHADHSGSQHFTIERGEAVPNPVKIESLMSLLPEPEEDEYVPEPEDEDDEELVAAPVAATASPQADASANGDEQGNRKRKRRRRRRGKNGPNGATHRAQASGREAAGAEDERDEADDDAAEGGSEAVAGDVDANGDDSQKRKRRRRGKRGGRRNRPGEEGSLEAGDENGEDGDDGEETDGVTETAAEMADERVVETSPSMAAVEATEEAPAVPAPKARRTRKAKVAPETAEPAVAEAAPAVVVAEPVVTEILEPAVAEAVEPVAAPLAAPAETPVADVVAEEAVVDESKPARANRESNVTSSQPVVTSVNASDENGEAAKPKKGGWWQKRGFF